MAPKRSGTMPAAALLIASCALADDVTGPIGDGDMSSAPYRACASSPEPSERSAAPPCLRLLLDGQPADLAAGPVRIAAGQSLLVLPTGAAGCAGDYTHFVLTGSSPAAGAMEMVAADAFARTPRRQRLSWRAPVFGRRWTMSGIGHALHTPSSMTVRVESGQVIAEAACLASYHR